MRISSTTPRSHSVTVSRAEGEIDVTMSWRFHYEGDSLAWLTDNKRERHYEYICELEREKEIFHEKEDNFDLKWKAIVQLDGNRTNEQQSNIGCSHSVFIFQTFFVFIMFTFSPIDLVRTMWNKTSFLRVLGSTTKISAHYLTCHDVACTQLLQSNTGIWSNLVLWSIVS